jgi:hypothetical protein
MADSLDAATDARGRHPSFRGLRRGFERLMAHRAQRAARRAADAELVLRENPPLRLAWRVEELVAPKNRLELAHSLRSFVRDASPRYLPGASPVNRLAVRAESTALLALADRLADLGRGVSARGVVFVERLLVDGAGPLYDRERVDELPVYLDMALAALEPR